MNMIQYRAMLEDLEKNLGKIGKVYDIVESKDKVLLDVEVDDSRQHVVYNKRITFMGGLR